MCVLDMLHQVRLTMLGLFLAVLTSTTSLSLSFFLCHSASFSRSCMKAQDKQDSGVAACFGQMTTNTRRPKFLINFFTSSRCLTVLYSQPFSTWLFHSKQVSHDASLLRQPASWQENELDSTENVVELHHVHCLSKVQGHFAFFFTVLSNILSGSQFLNNVLYLYFWLISFLF